MVMDAVGSAASAVGEALGLVKPDKAKLVCVGRTPWIGALGTLVSPVKLTQV